MIVKNNRHAPKTRNLRGVFIISDFTADRAGLTCQHIGRIEKGELANVAYVTIQQIAEALGMTVDIIDPGLQDLAPMKRLT